MWVFSFIVITWLLQHEPSGRPTALELSESPLMPPRLEDENFRGALNLMGVYRSCSCIIIIF